MPAAFYHTHAEGAVPRRNAGLQDGGHGAVASRADHPVKEPERDACRGICWPHERHHNGCRVFILRKGAGLEPAEEGVELVTAPRDATISIRGLSKEEDEVFRLQIARQFAEMIADYIVKKELLH
jgi:hypothetical protein